MGNLQPNFLASQAASLASFKAALCPLLISSLDFYILAFSSRYF